jgi:hypothetical protein
MNTMPFPDGSQEVPCSLLVALPEFRLNPLNGRTAPISVVPGHLAATRMQTFARHGGSCSDVGCGWKAAIPLRLAGAAAVAKVRDASGAPLAVIDCDRAFDTYWPKAVRL